MYSTDTKTSFLSAVFAIFFLTTACSMHGDCIIGRVCDGGIGVGCGFSLVVGGAVIAVVPGSIFLFSGANTNSTFLKLCAAACFVSGGLLAMGGASIILDGIKKFFGIKKKKKLTNIDQIIRIPRRTIVLETTLD